MKRLSKDEIQERLQALTDLATQRMDSAKHLPNLCYAGIFWLNDEELQEHFELVQELNILTQDSADNARQRIQQKISKRKACNAK